MIEGVKGHQDQRRCLHCDLTVVFMAHPTAHWQMGMHRLPNHQQDGAEERQNGFTVLQGSAYLPVDFEEVAFFVALNGADTTKIVP